MQIEFFRVDSAREAASTTIYQRVAMFKLEEALNRRPQRRRREGRTPPQINHHLLPLRQRAPRHRSNRHVRRHRPRRMFLPLRGPLTGSLHYRRTRKTVRGSRLPLRHHRRHRHPRVLPGRRVLPAQCGARARVEAIAKL